ncbi:MAG: LysM domain-containing protein, partial [Bacteroidetes bacterium]
MGIKHYISVILLLLSSLFSTAQQTDFVIEKINGKKYYMHYVEKGNTLYSISKKYNTTIEVIKENNPEIESEGLKPGMLLKIPFKKADPLKSIEESIKSSACENRIKHTVQPKETLYSLSKKYNVSIEKIVEQNPEIQTKGLQPQMVIYIPASQEASGKTEQIGFEKEESQTQDYIKNGRIIHIVQPKETLFSVSKKFKVTMQ